MRVSGCHDVASSLTGPHVLMNRGHAMTVRGDMGEQVPCPVRLFDSGESMRGVFEASSSSHSTSSPET